MAKTTWILIFVLLSLNSCILGDARPYRLRQDLTAEDVAHLSQLAESSEKGESLEAIFYSIPILPVYYLSRETELVPISEDREGFHMTRVSGLLYTILFATGEKAKFSMEGKNLNYRKESAGLLGLIFRSWSGWRTRENGLKSELFSGFSILWGFIEVEEDRGEESVSVFWIPM